MLGWVQVKVIMTRSKYEIVEIEELCERIGHSGRSRRTTFKASKLSPIGKTTLHKSKPIEWRTTNDKLKTAQLERELETVYHKLLESLLADGWEPIGTSPNGRVRSMRRLISKRASRRTFDLNSDNGWRSIDGLWINLATFTGVGVETVATGALTGGLQSAPLTGAF